MTTGSTPQVAPTHASVVIVGGGIMGTATAHYLAEAGVEDVVLVERDELGSGSTSKAAGGLRSQFSDEVNIALGARSLETFRRFRSDFDQDIDLVTSGYLFLLDDEEDAARFERNVALQQSLGQSSRMVTVAEAAELSPVISTAGLVGGAFNPDDAHCTPEAAVAGFARAARRRGVTVLRHTAVTDIVVEDGAVTGVETSRGPIATSTVVCAAGAWSQALGAMAGDGLSYWIGRRWGHGLRVVWPFSKYPQLLDRGENLFRRNAVKSILIARYVGAIRPFVPAIAGIAPKARPSIRTSVPSASSEKAKPAASRSPSLGAGKPAGRASTSTFQPSADRSAIIRRS